MKVTFKFELGEVDLNGKGTVKDVKVEVDSEMTVKELVTMMKEYGKMFEELVKIQNSSMIDWNRLS